MDTDFIKGEITAKDFFRNLFYTVVINTVIALLLTVSQIAESLPKALVISQSIGICIFSLMMALFWKLKAQKRSSEILIRSIGIIGGLLLGWAVASFLLQRVLRMPTKNPEKDFWQTVVWGIAFGLICSSFFISKAKLRAGKERIQEEQIKRLASEKEVLAANLKMLQAQIEPHFLFNTLSNILSLIDTDPNKGKTMLADLIRYLRTTLSRTRHDWITLGQEMEMIQAYLDIFKVRMGDRLQYEIIIPEKLRSQPFPPMLLQPLVENAIKHGLEPKSRGGAILIQAAETDGFCRIEIKDTGLGISAGQGSGIGLANVRERLRLLYGDPGRLILEENKPEGLCAIIEVPKHES